MPGIDIEQSSYPTDAYFALRCLSLPDNLDAISADRSREHTDRAVGIFNQTELGAMYGIIKQLVVSFDSAKEPKNLLNEIFSLLLTISRVPIFTN